MSFFILLQQAHNSGIPFPVGFWNSLWNKIKVCFCWSRCFYTSPQSYKSIHNTMDKFIQVGTIATGWFKYWLLHEALKNLEKIQSGKKYFFRIGSAAPTEFFKQGWSFFDLPHKAQIKLLIASLTLTRCWWKEKGVIKKSGNFFDCLLKWIR